MTELQAERLVSSLERLCAISTETLNAALRIERDLAETGHQLAVLIATEEAIATFPDLKQFNS